MLRRLPRIGPAAAPDPIREDLFGDDGRFRWSVVVFLAVNLIVGGVLRFVHLGDESIWYDEACSLAMANHSAGDILSGRAFDVGNPPGYFLLLHYWCEVFGYTVVSARALSAAAGTLTVLVAWLLCMSVSWDRRIAMIATTLVTINPALIFLSREARTFSINATLVTLLAYIAIRLVRRTRLIDWSVFLLCGTSLVFLHYYNLFLLCIVSVPVLWGRRNHLWTTLPCFVATAAAIAVPFSLWLPVFIRQLSAWAAPDVPWWKHALYFPVYVVGGRTFVWKQDGLYLMAAAWMLVLVAILAPVIWGLFRSPKSIGIPLAIGVGMPAVAVAMSILKDPMLNCRYLSPVIPCLVVAATVSIWWLSRQYPIIGGSALTIAVSVAIAALPRMYGERQKDDWRSAVAYLSRRADDSLVVFNRDIGVVPYQYYDPDVRALPLKMNFDPTSDSVAMRDYERRMRAAGEFWVVQWLADLDSDLPAVQRWLTERFDAVQQREFRGLVVQRYVAGAR